MLNKIVGAVTQIAEAGGSIVGIRSGTEEPDYTVEREIDGVQIRRYGPRIAAETTVESANEEASRSEGFRRLARYIFGANSGKDKIAMTAPVAQQQSEKIAMTAPVASQRDSTGDWVIQFFMPSKYTMDTLPTPKDERVRLVEVPGETVAVLRYNGPYGSKGVAAHAEKLLDTLSRNKIEAISEPQAWFYDPPWTVPFLRRNEVLVKLADTVN
ncbi:heme-binding protein [Mycobacterium sp. DL592]|uniref:SOUL family heme-binding protein n=1 Tax=Mycobacterium sp. DL592 TaxID=2675524 RepID=UPI00141DB4EC|nr:heme-binding protein [Mycobacterium sp. DL592]